LEVSEVVDTYQLDARGYWCSDAPGSDELTEQLVTCLACGVEVYAHSDLKLYTALIRRPYGIEEKDKRIFPA
jgi:hypothetical protein